jgi:hypothetical protein
VDSTLVIHFTSQWNEIICFNFAVSLCEHAFVLCVWCYLGHIELLVRLLLGPVYADVTFEVTQINYQNL